MASQAKSSGFQYRGVNHVALVCKDMAETVDFYENVLEMPLVKAMGIGGKHQHFFFDCGNGALIAFFWFAEPPPFSPGIASQPLDVAKDGMMTGPNFEATAALARAGKVPVIASGGVGNVKHVRRLTELPVWGVIIGRSLYEGTVDLKEAIKVAHGG